MTSYLMQTIRSARITLMTAAICIQLGCAHPHVNSSPSVPVVSQPPPPQSLSAADVQAIISKDMGVLAEKMIWMRCQSQLPIVGSSPTSPLGQATGPGAGQVSNYSVWLKYVSDHIRSGTPFGSDYNDIAGNALNGMTALSPGSDLCQGASTKDTDLQQLYLQTSPTDIGNKLYSDFSGYDQPTRDSAATDINPPQ
jgi:hypothetical protein